MFSFKKAKGRSSVPLGDTMEKTTPDLWWVHQSRAGGDGQKLEHKKLQYKARLFDHRGDQTP